MRRALIALALVGLLAAGGLTAFAVAGATVTHEYVRPGTTVVIPAETFTDSYTLPDPVTVTETSPPVTVTETVTETVTVTTTAPAPSCDKYASTSGSDTAAGTQAAPYRTAQKLVSSLTAGKKGCLMGGTFVEDVTFTVGGTSDSARVTLMTAPGYPQATVNGYIYQPPSSSYVTVDNLHVLVRTTTSGNLMQMFGDYARVTNCDVDGNHQNVAGGVSLGFQRKTVGSEIDHNRIHGFGASRSIYYHGIYAAFTSSGEIHDNVITDNVGGYGITLWPSASGLNVHHNTFDGNGAGNVQIAGQKDPKGGPSSNNLFERNVLTNPASGWNTNIFWGNWSSDHTNAGTGNVVRDNLYWNGALDPGSAYGSGSGVTYTGNVNADPALTQGYGARP